VLRSCSACAVEHHNAVSIAFARGQLMKSRLMGMAALQRDVGFSDYLLRRSNLFILIS
jgi:hypothetical protein